MKYERNANVYKSKYERQMYEILHEIQMIIRKKYEGHTNEIHTNEIQLKYERNANVYKQNNYFFRAGPRATGKF